MNAPQQGGGYASRIDEIRYLAERGRFDQARRVLSAELSQKPEDPELLFLGGYLDWLQDRDEDALKAISLVLSRVPHHEGARAVLFRLHKQKGRLHEAEEVILSLLKDYPNDAQYFADYSELMLTSYEVDKARRLSEEAIRLEPDNEHSLRAMVLCSFVLDSRADFQEKISELLRQYPSSASTIGTVMHFLMLQRRPQEALVLAQTLVREHPGNKDLVDVIVNLKTQTHWTMLPLWPQVRFGWFGIIGSWIGLLFVVNNLDSTPLAAWQGAATTGMVLFFFYNWLWPRWLHRALRD